MNPSYKEREVVYQLSNSEAVAVVVQHELLPLVQVARAGIPLPGAHTDNRDDLLWSD
jgi:long-chain acyl-CoA synthetase